MHKPSEQMSMIYDETEYQHQTLKCIDINIKIRTGNWLYYYKSFAITLEHYGPEQKYYCTQINWNICNVLMMQCLIYCLNWMKIVYASSIYIIFIALNVTSFSFHIFLEFYTFYRIRFFGYFSCSHSENFRSAQLLL